MPRLVPPDGYTKPIKLDKGLVLGVVVANGNYKNDYYTARIYFPGHNTVYKSTGIVYQPGDEILKEKAIAKAFEVYYPMRDKHQRGENLLYKRTVGKVIDDYFAEADRLTNINEKLKNAGQPPTAEIKNGKGYWSDSHKKQLEYKKEKLIPFWETLRTKEIESITYADLNSFLEWSIDTHPSWSPSTRNKYVSLIRSIWSFAFDKQYVSQVHKIDRAKPQAVRRRRRQMTDEEFIHIRDYSLSKYKEPGMIDYWRDLREQFHHWIMIMSWTGIRVPTGTVENTAIRWEHYEVINRDGIERRFLHRPDEKNHSYYAFIHPQSHANWDALINLHKKRSTYNPDGYVFVHTHNGEDKYNYVYEPYERELKNGRVVTGNRRVSLNARNGVEGASGGVNFFKGDRIKSFKNQWNNMLKELDKRYPGNKYAVPVGTPQSERLSPYSLRGYSISKTIDANPELPIEIMARHVGTSPQQIEQIYYKEDQIRAYDRVTSRSKDELKPSADYLKKLIS
tara:strand:+ start:7362 stop:8885 length:1524 start_codon:yes stop_codon:yes gene_type:complete